MKKSILIITLFLLALTASAALAQAPEGEAYTVQADDWLSKIAEKEYGNVLAYPAIVEATNAKAAEDDSFAVIDNPDVIEVGQKLWIPAEAEGVAMAEAAPAAPANFGEAWQSVSCATFDLSDEIAAISDCGYVTVPEHHSQPDGPTIQVAVVRTRSTGDNPAPDPFFMEQGGPGDSTIGVFPTQGLPQLPNLQNILATRDMVFVEERGTLYSRPNLICSEKLKHDIQVAKGLIENLDRSFVAACRDRLAAEGVNFSAFNSVENAADMYFVAETLGYDSFNFYGTSYGTLLGQYVIEQAEEHTAQLRSIMIDAVVTSNIEFNAPAGSTASYALRNLFAECAQDEQCNQKFPDLETVFFALVDQLNQQPVPATLNGTDEAGEPLDPIETTLDGQDLVLAVFTNLYSFSDNRSLPSNIYQAAQNNNFAWVADALAPSYAPHAEAMYVSVLCARANSIQADGATFFDPPYEQFRSLGEEAAEELRRGCELIPVDLEEPFVLDNTGIPTLIYNGSRDPITPLPYGQYVGSQLSNAYVVTVPGSGHGSMLFLPCPGQVAVDFLADPTQAPDLSCINDMQPIFDYAEEAATGLGDTYFPLEGNPGYDAQHYTIELAVASDDLHYINGTTTIEALATSDLPSFNLDFLGLTINGITVDGTETSFSRDGQELTITPATPIAEGASFSVSVNYEGRPEPYADPAMTLYHPPLIPLTLRTGWIEWGEGYIGAMSQPDGGMTWFPSNNHPSDKATYTYRITVDAPKMALATGILEEVIPVDDDTNTYVWQMDQPMSTQITSVMIGEFELVESQAPNGVPIRNYFTPGLDQAIIDGYDRTGEMLVFLADVFGPYPFDAYGVVTIPGWVPESGLESQSLTTMSESPTGEDIIVHELGHQWFGDALTVADWGDVWLHEGFARYIEALWFEESQGPAAYNTLIQDQYWYQTEVYPTLVPEELGVPSPVEEGQVLAPVDPPLDWMYFVSYTGGALALHTLRMEVGDDVFFEILPTFFQRFQNVPVTTEDFIATAEEVSGRDLSDWADTWLYSNEIPAEFPLLPE